MKNYIVIIEQYLKELMMLSNPLKEAMSYSVLQRGKRIRPIIFLMTLTGFNIDYKKYLDIASAIEIIHISTLVHDDLPEMDNDDYRRGELTAHKKFNHMTALLSGDALLIKSYELIMTSACSDDCKVKMGLDLSKMIGDEGLLLGQYYDMSNSNDVETIFKLKTANLLTIPFLFACQIANRENNSFIEIANKLGLAFQIQDDLQDYHENGKMSLYLQKYGTDESLKQVEILYKQIIELIQMIGEFDSEKLLELIRSLKNRRS